MALHRRQGRLGVEAGQDHQVGALAEAGHRGGERAVVIERSGHDHDVVASGAIGPDLDRRIDARAAREDQLGPAGRSAGGGRLPDRRRAVGKRAFVAAAERDQGRNIETRTVAGRDGVTGDDHRGAGQLHDGLGLGGRQAPGDRLGRRPDFPEAVAGLDEVDAVGQAHGDEIGRLDARRLQAPGDGVGAPVELAPGDRAVGVGDGRGVRPFRRELAKARAQRDRPRRGGRFAHARRDPTGCEDDRPPSTTIAWPFT